MCPCMIDVSSCVQYVVCLVYVSSCIINVLVHAWYVVSYIDPHMIDVPHVQVCSVYDIHDYILIHIILYCELSVQK